MPPVSLVFSSQSVGHCAPVPAIPNFSNVIVNVVVPKKVPFKFGPIHADCEDGVCCDFPVAVSGSPNVLFNMTASMCICAKNTCGMVGCSPSNVIVGL